MKQKVSFKGLLPPLIRGMVAGAIIILLSTVVNTIDAQSGITTYVESPQRDNYWQHPVVDTYVASGRPDQSLNSARGLWVGYDQQGGFNVQRTLLKFDLSTIPVGSRINRATISLYSQTSRPGNDVPMTVGAHRLRSAWDENITWNQHLGLNLDSDPITTALISDQPDWVSWDITALAQEWLNDPNRNYGIILQGNESPSQHERGFWSKECRNDECDSPPGLRPRVDITFDLPTPTPRATSTPPSLPTATAIPVGMTLSLENNPAAKLDDTISYTIIAKNINYYRLTNVQVTGPIPDNTTYLPDSASAGGVYQQQENQVLWNIGNLAANSQRQFTYLVAVGGMADLQVSQTGAETVNAGDGLVYTLIVTNNSRSPARGVRLIDTLPAEVSFNAAIVTQGHGNCPEEPTVSTIVCTVEQLQSGQSATIALIVTVDSNATEVIENHVSVTADQYDPNDGNNSAMASTSIEADELTATPTSIAMPTNTATPTGTATPTSTYDFANRFSLDKGENWVYGDLDGGQGLLIMNQAQAVSDQTGVVRSNYVFNGSGTLYLPVMIE